MDDADAAERATLDQIARLCRYDPSPEMQLTVVLAGRNDGMARLGEPLADLSDLRIELEPWQREDVERLIDSRLAGGEKLGETFEASAIDRLHELSHGIPRRVCRLADMALLAGAGAGLPRIDAETIESVWQEVGIRD
jgi:general secretion pathway protein A